MRRIGSAARAAAPIAASMAVSSAIATRVATSPVYLSVTTKSAFGLTAQLAR